MAPLSLSTSPLIIFLRQNNLFPGYFGNNNVPQFLLSVVIVGFSSVHSCPYFKGSKCSRILRRQQTTHKSGRAEDFDSCLRNTRGFCPREGMRWFDVQEALEACKLRRGCNSFFPSPTLASEETPLPVGIYLTTNKNKMLSAGSS